MSRIPVRPARRCVFTLLALAANASALAMEVPAGPLSVEPYARPLFQDGRFEIHPTASNGAGWDSNVDGSGKGDLFAHATAGGHAHWYANRDLDADLDLELGLRSYKDTTSRNTVDLSLDSDVRYAGPEWDLTGAVNAKRGRESEPLTGEQLLLVRYGTAIGGERRNPGPYYKFGLSADRTTYLEDSRLYDRNQVGNDRIGGELKIGWHAVNDTKAYLFERTTGTLRDEEGRFRNGVVVVLGGGLGFTPSSVATIGLDAGVALARYTAPFNDDAAYGDRQVVAPYVAAMLRWEPEPGSTVTWRVENGLGDGITANAVRRLAATVYGEFRLRERLKLYAGGGWRREQDSGAPRGFSPPVRHITNVDGGIRGTPWNGIGLQLGGGLWKTADSAGQGNDRWMIEGTVGIAF